MTVENFQTGICTCWPHKQPDMVSRLVATAKLMQQQQADQDPNTINYITTLSPVSCMCVCVFVCVCASVCA